MKTVKAQTENGIHFLDVEINEKNVMLIDHTERYEVGKEEFNCTADLHFPGDAMLTILLRGYEGDPRPEDIILDVLGVLEQDPDAWGRADTVKGLTAIRRDAINYIHPISDLPGMPRPRKLVRLADGSKVRICGELGRMEIIG